jgi:dCTP deaminase
MKGGGREPFDVRGGKEVGQYYDVHSNVSAFVISSCSRCLAHTLETVTLPKDLMGFCELRSSYARLDLSIPPTIIDAGFEGQLTIEIVGSSSPVKVYPFNRCLHVVFSMLTTPAVKACAGKYLRQRGVQLPIFKRYTKGDTIFNHEDPSGTIDGTYVAWES